MENTHFNFKSKDGLTLFGRAWISSAAQNKGTVNLIHGLGEHSGRYAHVAKALNAAGYHVTAFDLRGHGLSEGKRGHTPDFDHLLDDIAIFLEESQSQTGNHLSKFLYGHSLGANLVLNYGLRRRPNISGIIATSPSLKFAFEPPKLKILIGKIMAELLPAFTMSNGLEVDALSRDKAVVKAYQDDVYVHDRISARLAMDLIESGLFILDHANEWTHPLLLIHGTEDRITSHTASKEFALKVNHLVDLYLFEGSYHETHNDFDKLQVIQKMIDWLNEKTAGGA
jgi:alpha-beta hydrolase superfamily lysophospholipase